MIMAASAGYRDGVAAAFVILQAADHRDGVVGTSLAQMGGAGRGPHGRPYMFQRILVPTDLTDSTHRALAMAVDFARLRFGSQVTLLHVIERVPNLPDRELRDFYQRLEHVACARIRTLLGEISGTGEVSVTHHVAVGRPADEIVQYAERNNMDLIVLQHDDDHSRFGSVSYKVSVTAPCSVMLLRASHV
jgi:nucleotide-binding universal stress UspA family protein